MPKPRGFGVIGWLYRKIYVAIVPGGDKYDVSVALYKRKKCVRKESRHFEGSSAIDDIARYVRKATDESPLHYVAVLNPDSNQGALEGCSVHEINDTQEMSGTKTLCRNNKWMLYASARELDLLTKKFSKAGVDFVFSPFSVIEHFFADKINGKLAIYALTQKDSLSVAFFESGQLAYAHHYPMHRQQRATSAEDNNAAIGFSIGVDDESEKEGIHLDQIEMLDDLDIIDDLDDLSDIEDLDTLEEIAEFSEEEPVFEESKIPVYQRNETKEEADRFSDDYYRFELIEKALTRFYASENCHNRFVETLYLADGYGSGTELKRYLEEELFLNVVVRKIDLGEEVIALSIQEGEG